MARTIKEAEYNARRNEILDAAQSLIYSKGYQQMTIQDILDALHISRGALYHYFDSKQALLEALVDRMGHEAEQGLRAIVKDSDLTAIEKFRRYFVASAQWKSTQKELIVGLLSMWYTDENAFIRQKITAETAEHTALFFEPIIRQGIEENSFTTQYPKQVAAIVAGVALSLTDSIVGLLLSSQPDQAAFQEMDTILDAYFDTVERILGAPAGSMKVFGSGAFEEWLEKDQTEPAAE